MVGFKTKPLILCLYLFAVVASSMHAEVKYRSLNFQTRDYAYYLQFSAKLLDSRMAKSYSLNPEGYNWLRYNGTEGAGNFHRSLHFEPIKYLYGVLYFLAKTPRVLFWFTALVYFLPLVYLAFAVPHAEPFTKSECFVLLVALLYILSPPALLMPGYDLRPYVFLPPFFFMAVMSVKFCRPLRERLLWFNCLFLAREEALILAPSLILLAIVMEGEASLQQRTVVSFSIAWVIWAGLTLGFFKWTGYPTSFFQTRPDLFQVLALCGVILLALALAFAAKLRRQNSYRRPLQIAAYGSVFIPLSFQFFEETRDAFSPSMGWVMQTVFAPRYALYYAAILGLAFVWRTGAAQTWGKAQMILPGCVVAMLLALIIFSSPGVVRTSAGYLREVPPARDVFAVREITDKYQSNILVDYATHQAFADYQNVYVFNRLPWEMTPGESRYYPANSEMVQTLVNERIDYVVTSRASAEAIRGFLSRSNLQTVPLFENEKFFAMKIVRKSLWANQAFPKWFGLVIRHSMTVKE